MGTIYAVTDEVFYVIPPGGNACINLFTYFYSFPSKFGIDSGIKFILKSLILHLAIKRFTGFDMFKIRKIALHYCNNFFLR